LVNEKPGDKPATSPEPPLSPQEQKSPSWYHVVSSVLAAGFGVQSKKNRERDFQHGKPIVFIITGLVFTFVFIAAVILVVSTVLDKAG
jgi:hypothetical protein